MVGRYHPKKNIFAVVSNYSLTADEHSKTFPTITFVLVPQHVARGNGQGSGAHSPVFVVLPLENI